MFRCLEYEKSDTEEGMIVLAGKVYERNDIRSAGVRVQDPNISSTWRMIRRAHPTSTETGSVRREIVHQQQVTTKTYIFSYIPVYQRFRVCQRQEVGNMPLDVFNSDDYHKTG